MAKKQFDPNEEVDVKPPEDFDDIVDEEVDSTSLQQELKEEIFS